MYIVELLTGHYRNLRIETQEVEVKPALYLGEKKRCFDNSYKFIVEKYDGNLKYVLGFIVVAGLPIEHAWIKRGQDYIDVTLVSQPGDRYISCLELSLQELLESVSKIGYAPDFYSLNKIK